MGLFLGVTNGSEEPPRFVELHYKGHANPDSPPVVLVGKGITFDSGGISIKPAASMKAMKADMMGAAVVLNTLIAVAQLKLPINLVALTPMCENLPSGKATKPGDVHTASNGTTVEVDNTDAEGRLILGDALVYGDAMKPHTMIDVATLTGAIGMALGDVYAGAFTKDDKLWKEIKKAGDEVGEPFWRMPLSPAYATGLKSNVADLVNIAGHGAKGGASIAAAFLSHFVKHTQRWVHLDIAGVMESSGSSYTVKGMTGKSMRALVEFLTNLSKTL
jgi:aminopeptidase